MNLTDNEAVRLLARYQDHVVAARSDLYRFSGISHVFLDQGMEAFTAKETRQGVPSLTHILPHMLAEGLHIRDVDRRKLASAWIAVNAYIALADHAVDSGETIHPQAFMSASALLAWSLSTLAQFTSGTRFAPRFIENINAALAGQHQDWMSRDGSSDREKSDIDKNRAVVAVSCAYAAAAGRHDDLLPDAVLHILAPLQVLDDLLDLEEDIAEGNCTSLVRLLADDLSDHLSSAGALTNILRHPHLSETLVKAKASLEEAMALLDQSEDVTLFSYVSYLRREITDLVGHLESFRQGRGLSEDDMRDKIATIVCST